MDMEPMEAKHMMQGAGTFDRLVGEGTRRRNLVLLQLKVASCWLAVFIYIYTTNPGSECKHRYIIKAASAMRYCERPLGRHQAVDTIIHLGDKPDVAAPCPQSLAQWHLR